MDAMNSALDQSKTLKNYNKEMIEIKFKKEFKLLREKKHDEITCCLCGVVVLLVTCGNSTRARQTDFEVGYRQRTFHIKKPNTFQILKLP